MVDTADLSLLSAAYGQTVGLYGQNGATINGAPEWVEWVDGDFDYSSTVDSQDYSLLVVAYTALPPLW